MPFGCEYAFYILLIFMVKYKDSKNKIQQRIMKIFLFDTLYHNFIEDLYILGI